MRNACWVALAIRVSEEVSEAVGNRLLELGAPGIITEDDGQKGSRLTAYFRRQEWEEARPLLDRYILALRELFPAMSIEEFRVQPVKEENWAENWKQYFPPTVVSPRLLVTPPWAEPVHAPGKIPLVIEPGMAFGTGVHATTRLVLCALDEILLNWHHTSPARVLDVGTGSGILAIAAARLGAGEVVGIDTDPIAIVAAEENLARNGLKGRAILRRCSVEDVCGMYDLILANLTCQLLTEKHRFLVQALAPEGYLVASGFLARDLQEIAECYADEPMRQLKEESMEKWHLMVWQRLAQHHYL